MRFLGVLVLSGCGLTSATAPAGLVCDRVAVAEGSLADALSAAKPKDCVIALSGTYVGAFTLPEDVSLAASQGSTVILKGDGSGQPVLTVRGGRRSTVRGIRIDTSAGTGVAIDPGPANLVGVVITGNTTRAAVTSSCMRGGCDEVLLEDCELGGSSTGLLVSGGKVRVERGRIAGMGGTGLSDGSGVVASLGADVALNAVVIEANAQIGVLVDGASTHVALDGTKVNGNLERGMWIQNVSGTGSVTVNGGELSANHLVGIGVRDSAGVRLTGVIVKDTVAKQVPIGINQFEAVGDGVGLFSGARDVVLDAVRSQANARAQILADASGTGVQVTAPELSGGQFRVVVQRGAAAVDVPAALVDAPGRDLAVKSELVPIAQ